MKTKFVQQKQIAQRKLNSCKSIFLLAFMLINCALIAQQSNICVDAVLDFSNPGYHWEHNATYGNFEVEDQHFEIKIKDGDGILQDVKEAGAGIMVGTEPHSVYDNVSIIYQLSESTSNVQFSIRDLDYKNYGHGSSNQQEAVCIFGYCGDTEVMPVITSLDGSVHISGNCAEATTDSRHGHDESIQVTFNQCVDKIKIKYGTGSNSPVHNPTYGKIFIGEVGGVTASTCNSTCNGCDDLCPEAALNFSNKGIDWHENSTSGDYSINGQDINISIEDNDHILQDTFEEGASLLVGIEPHTVDDVVDIRYELSQKTDQVQFVIRDLDFKNNGHGYSNQQEEVCIFGYRDGIEVLPVITLLDGSVKIIGNCAQAMDNSRNGHDESIEVTFEECIDEVLIIYGNGPLTPVDNPSYSKIYIGDDYGFLAGYCEDTCIDCQLTVDAGSDVEICSNDAVELAADVAGNSICNDNLSVTFLWSTGETTPSILASQSGNYTVTVTDCNGCEATDDINVTITPDPEANAGEDVVICVGEAAELAASGGQEYTWSNGETGNIITVEPTETTTYTVTVSNGNGCQATDEVTVTVAENPIADAGSDVAICLGSSIELTAQGGGEYEWNNGMTDASITMSPVETTTYSVTVTSAEGCTSNDEVVVTVNENPIADAGSDVAICLGSSIELTAQGGGEYEWNNGMTDASITMSPAETTTYSVTVTSAEGCTGNDEVVVTVNENPIVAVDDTEICLGAEASVLATGFAVTPVQFLWNNGQNTANLIVSPAQTTEYEITITDENGCSNAATTTVTVNDNPVAEAIGDEVCLGAEAQISAAGGESYAWNTGEATAAIAATPAQTTEYTVIVTDENGCTDETTATVIVNENPTANVNNAEICVGEDAELEASGGTSYSWIPSLSGQIVTVSPTIDTEYVVTVTDENGCTNEATATVIVNENPTPSATGAEICAGEEAQLSATGGESYIWNTGEETAAIAATPAGTTDYTVTVTDENGCKGEASATVTVNENPTPSATGAEICAGEEAQLSATGGESYIWNTGEETAAIAATPAGTTDYTVTVTDANGCKGEASATVTVNENPVAAATGDEVCSGEEATLTATGGESYVWNTGDTTGTLAIIPAGTTDYTVTVTDANGCKGEASATATVNPIPAAAATGDEVCSGEEAQLTATGGLSYVWNTGDTTGTLAIIPAGTTDYTVTVTDANGCTGEATATATVNENPVVAATGDEVCSGEEAQLTATGGLSYVWNTGDTTGTLAIIPAGTTDYTVTVTDANGCTGEATATATVNENPVAGATGDEVCSGEEAQLTATGGLSYVWNTGDTTGTLAIIPAGTTDYTVTVTDANGCTGEATATATVNPIPAAAVTSDEVCSGEEAQLTASGGQSYVWNTGETTETLAIIPTETTDYTVIVTDANGCTAEASGTATLSDNPVITLENASVCGGEPATLTATGGATYEWSTGDTTAEITVNPTSNATYTVTVTTESGCIGTGEALVTVNPPPVITIAPPNDICEGETVTLTASGADSYSWSNGETGASIDVMPTSNATYTVDGTSLGCTGSAETTVNVKNIRLGVLELDSIFCRVPTSGESIKASIVEESEFCEEYVQYFILTTGDDRTIVDFIPYIGGPSIKFNVAQRGDGIYAIHSFVANPNDVILVNGVSTTVLDYLNAASADMQTIQDLNGYLEAGDITAGLDMDGAQTTLGYCKLGTSNQIDYEVYPNPATDVLYFKSINVENLVSIELTNIDGKLLEHIKLSDAQSEISIDVKNYANGIYLLKVTGALTSTTTKIVIE